MSSLIRSSNQISKSSKEKAVCLRGSTQVPQSEQTPEMLQGVFHQSKASRNTSGHGPSACSRLLLAAANGMMTQYKLLHGSQAIAMPAGSS
jgi:hypothetical protein